MAIKVQTYFVILRFANIAFLNEKWRICDSSSSNRSTSAGFSTALTQFVFVSRFGNSHNISNFPIVIIFGVVIRGF